MTIRHSAGPATLLTLVLLASRASHAADPVPVGSAFEVEADSYVNPQLPDVAGVPTGEFVVVWSRAGGGYRTYARAFAADGTPASGNVALGGGAYQFSRYPQVAAGAGGTFVVVWTQEDVTPSDAIEARVLDATGTPQGPQFTVGTLRSYEFSPTIAAHATGEFVVAWDDYPDPGSGTQEAYGRRLDASGALAGSIFPVKVGATDWEEAPAVATMPGGGFVAVWDSEALFSPPSALVGQLFDAANMVVGGEFVVTTHAYIGTYPSQGRRHAVASNAAGDFAVAWETDSTSRILVQRFDATGTPLGTPLQASQNAGARGPDLLMEDDGSFVVVWSDEFQEGIVGRRFSAISGTFGDEFVVSDASVSEPPALASTGPSSFVVAWADAGVSYDRVLARQFVVPQPQEVGIAGAKLIAVDTVAAAGKAKIAYLAKDDPGIVKGTGGDPALFGGRFEVVYTDQPQSVVGRFMLPSPWRAAEDTVAKYVNSLAPAGTGDVKVAVVKDGLKAKVVAKALGDGPSLDLVAAGAPGPGGVTTAFTIVNGNDGTERRMCTRFSEGDGSTVVFREIAGGTGRKLIVREGVAAACP